MAFQKKVPKRYVTGVFYLHKFSVQSANTFPDKKLGEKSMFR